MKGKTGGVGFIIWCENRSGLVNNRVKECIDQRRMANKNDRHMRENRLCR